MLSNMNAAEYKLVVLGLIFLKYISDAFGDLYQKMKALTSKLAEQFAKGNELEKTIRENLKGIGYEF